MPELPDITVYIDALRERIAGREIRSLRFNSPFLLRTAEPPILAALDQPVNAVQRIGKRISLELPGPRYLVFHLMIAGRLQWYSTAAKIPPKKPLLFMGFDNGTLTMTEAGSKKRASLHFIDGAAALTELDPQGLEIMDTDLAEFQARLTLRNHTLKRALTSPRLFSGIGNAYSDEILHAAKLSPVRLTQKMDTAEIEQLRFHCQQTLTDWTEKLRAETGTKFPMKVTAFREGMAVHGRYQQPCPECDTLIQRIRYASSETNYCPRCQTNGKLLADRSLSRLLKQDWPKTIEELESGKS